MEVFLYGELVKLPPDAQVNYERWVELGEVFAHDAFMELDIEEDEIELLVDALFGTGLTRGACRRGSIGDPTDLRVLVR